MTGQLSGCVALIPAHNEEATIRAVVEGTLAHLGHVIVIDDGSQDATAARLQDLPVEVIAHPENRGKGTRLVEGLRHAFSQGAEAVLTLDADGQHAPDDIPGFLTAAATHPGHLIIGDRSADRENMPRGRAASIGFGDFFISWATGRRLRDCQCGLRLYPAAIAPVLDMPERDRRHFVFETAILLRAAERGIHFARTPIPARYSETPHRPSHYRPVKDTLRITWAITRFLLARGLRPRGLLIALGLLR